LGLTRRHILGFRKLLFGNVSELSDAVTDYQLMKFILASVGATHDVPHGCQVKLSKVCAFFVLHYFFSFFLMKVSLVLG